MVRRQIEITAKKGTYRKSIVSLHPNGRKPDTKIQKPTCVFISHNNRDLDLAKLFGNLITDVSGGAVKIFYAADKTPMSGITFSKKWYDDLIINLHKATDIVVLLTKNSINCSWVFFEAGFKQGEGNIPVGIALGISLEEACKGPFAVFQNYEGNEEGLTKLLVELIKKYNPSATPRREDVLRRVRAFVKHTNRELNSKDPINSMIGLNEERRFLEQRHVGHMLSTAIKQDCKLPICRNLATSHAAASAVAGVSVLIMLDKMCYLRNELRTKYLELMRESEDIPQKLAEHIGSVSDMLSLLSRFINEQCPQTRLKTTNDATRVFWELPGCRDIYRSLFDIVKKLRECIYQTYGVYENDVAAAIRPRKSQMMREVESHEWRKTIRQTFNTMMVSLETSREGFDKAIQTVIEKRESINRDWEQNIIQIWTEEEQGKKIHKPNPQKTVSLS